MYCPLLDGHIIEETKKLAQAKFLEEIYGPIQLSGKDEFQDLICALPVIPAKDSDILHFNTIVADKAREAEVAIFWKQEHMQMQQPEIKESTDVVLNYIVATVLSLQTQWNTKHKAKQHDYRIASSESHTGEAVSFKGYTLEEVKIALNRSGHEISACIQLNDTISIRLTDMAAFGNKNLEILDEKTLYTLVKDNPFSYPVSGKIIAPCIKDEARMDDHLKDIGWISPSGDRVTITASQSLVQLQLNEKGVEAHAFAFALPEIVYAEGKVGREYCLYIINDLVVDIRINDKIALVGYFPQHRFITTE